MKGVSEIVSTIIILLIVITSASAFFYWYQTLEGQAMGTSSEFTTNMQKQIISTSTSIIDTYYSADKQANINNYGGTTETICANDREIDLTNSKIGFIMWEGWGSNKELICSSYSLPCGCVGVETDILSATLLTPGLRLISSTVHGTWVTKKESTVPILVSNPTITDVHSIEFVEGGDSCKNPSNIFISGSSCDTGGESCGDLNIIWDGDDKASSYEEDNSYAAGKEVYWYDSVTMPITSPNWPSTLNKPRLVETPQPTFLGGAAVTTATGAYAKALLSAKYSVYNTHSILGSFGNVNGKVDASGVTAIEKIIRGDQNQLLIGVSKDPVTGSGYSYIDETVSTVNGLEKYYAGTMPECPYNHAQFAGAGYAADGGFGDKIAGCNLNTDSISSMLYDDRFDILGDGVILGDTRPVYVGVSGVDLSAGGGPPNTSKLIYTGRNMDTPTVFNIINDHAAFVNTEIVDMVYSPVDKKIVVAANDLTGSPIRSYLVYFEDAPVPVLSGIESVHTTTGGKEIVITSLEYFDDKVYFGGYDLLGGAVIFSVTDTRVDLPESYADASFDQVSSLTTLTKCSENSVHCSQGCDKTLAPGQCGDITLTFENTACDISNYPAGTQFSYSLNIGEHFTRSSIFEKKTAKTNELNVEIL